MRTFLLFCLAALPGLAQLRSVEIKVSGLDCPSCAGSITTRLMRIRGVETVNFDQKGATVLVRLAATNKASLHLIRDALKGLGYTPGDATVVVRGTAREDAGKVILSIPDQPDAFTLTGPAKASGPVEIEGAVSAGGTTLIPKTIKAE